jgi:hypothetical protein
MPSRRVDLLRDIKTVMDGLSKKPAVATSVLLEGLHALEDGGWAGLDAWNLAKELRRFKIGPPTTIRGIGREGKSAKGYLRKWFEDAWDRYLPPRESDVPGPDGCP